MSSSLIRIGTRFYTRTLVPGQRVYGERLVTREDGEWREWNPFRSKLAAALHQGLEKLPIDSGDAVLYLGSAEGTTVSHVSDIVGNEGLVVGVEFSPRAMTKFSALVETRENILPILADANDPKAYASELKDLDFQVVVQDISQRNQTEIFLRNMKALGKKGTQGLLVIKSRSIDFVKHPEKVFEGELATLQRELKVIQTISLGKFEKDHFLIHCEHV